MYECIYACYVIYTIHIKTCEEHALSTQCMTPMMLNTRPLELFER